MKKKIVCLLVFLSCYGICTAQQVVSSGGYAIESGFFFNWILGSSSDVPAFDSSILHASLIESEVSLKVYPSPAIDLFNIEIKPVCTGWIILELYNYEGVKVLSKKTTYQPVFQVNVSGLSSGFYLLKITFSSKDQLIKVEKIIKKQN